MMVLAVGQRNELIKSYLLDRRAYRGIVCTTWNSTSKGSPNDFAPWSVHYSCAGIFSGRFIEFRRGGSRSVCFETGGDPCQRWQRELHSADREYRRPTRKLCSCQHRYQSVCHLDDRILHTHRRSVFFWSISICQIHNH